MQWTSCVVDSKKCANRLWWGALILKQNGPVTQCRKRILISTHSQVTASSRIIERRTCLETARLANRHLIELEIQANYHYAKEIESLTYRRWDIKFAIFL